MSDRDPSLRRNAPALELHVPEPKFRPGDRVRDKWDGERGEVVRVYDWPGEGWGEVRFERHGLCRIAMRRLQNDTPR